MAPPGRIVDAPHANPVAFDVTGSGPIAVLVHGITENRTFWDDVTAGLAEHRTVVRVDLPGHGESGPGIDYSLTESAGAVFAASFAVTGELGLSEPPDLVGHSLGGTVVLQAIEPALQGDQFAATIVAMFAGMTGMLSTADANALALKRRPEQGVVLGTWAPILEAPLEALEAMVSSLGAAVTAPYLAIHGIDPGDEYPGWLESLMPESAVGFELWPDHGHYPHVVDPDRFVATVTEFWRSI